MFYDDEQVNNFSTMVCGTDLCEMLGLFHDIAEAINVLNHTKIAELEKFKIAYNNRVRRDKRREQEQKEEDKKRDEIDDEKFAAVRKHNSQMLLENERLKQQLAELSENLDLLVQENEEKDALIKELELDLKEKSHHTEHLT